jgi:hypothetical protein
MASDITPPEEVEPRHGLRMLLRNPISLAGIALAIVGIANIFLFVLIDLIAVKPSPYIGILAYMISPAFFGLGLLLDGGTRIRIGFADARQHEPAALPRS